MLLEQQHSQRGSNGRMMQRGPDPQAYPGAMPGAPPGSRHVRPPPVVFASR